MLMLADGTFFPPGFQCRSVGPRQRTRGSSPRSPAGAWVLLQGFFREFLPVCGAFVSTGIGDVPAGFCHAHMTSTSCVRCTPGGLAVRRAPEPGLVRGDRGEHSILFQTHPRRPFAGRRVRFPQPPSIWSRIEDSSLSCYQVVQVDAHAPFDKGWLVVRRLVHKSAHAGLLGGARSRSLGTEGAEALPRWDPPTSCTRWLSNTTCGASSSRRARG
jgi:hypothetical protein